MESRNKKTKDNKFYDYYGYLVYPDSGLIKTKGGKEICLKGSEQVYLTIKGKRTNLKRARVVYEAVTGQDTKKSDIFIYKDGNCLNAAFDNIERISKKQYYARMKQLFATAVFAQA